MVKYLIREDWTVCNRDITTVNEVLLLVYIHKVEKKIKNKNK